MENIDTPPDTIAVRKALLQHRKALAEIRGSRANFAEVQLATPKDRRTVENLSVTFNDTLRAENLERRLRELLLYKNPAATFIVALGCFVFLSAVKYLSEAGATSSLKLICHIILGRIAYNVAKSIFSGESKATLLSSEELEKLELFSKMSLHKMAAIHDAYISGEKPLKTMYVCIGLNLTSYLGSFFTVHSIVTTSLFLLFSVPYLLHSHWDTIQPIIADIKYALKILCASWGVTRKRRIIAITILCLFIWCRSSWPSRISAILTGLLAIRCSLKPHEIAVIREQTAPLTQSVKKSARRFSIAANEFAQKTLRS
eukprot:jgi/Picsp_1/477/NSC_00475-R1_hypothetical protein COCSUDRAFT_54200 [Coccomyxa subellipsoidea C-169]